MARSREPEPGENADGIAEDESNDRAACDRPTGRDEDVVCPPGHGYVTAYGQADVKEHENADGAKVPLAQKWDCLVAVRRKTISQMEFVASSCGNGERTFVLEIPGRGM